MSLNLGEYRLCFSGKFLHGVNFCGFSRWFGCYENKKHKNLNIIVPWALASASYSVQSVVLLEC